MRRSRIGFTLAELVVALSITSVVGLAVAGVASVLSGAYEHSEDYYQCLQGARVASMRLANTVRTAKLVTACSGEAIVIWAEDTNADGQINVTEVVSVYRDTASLTLLERRTVLPDSLSPLLRQSMDYVVPLSALTDVAAGTNLAPYPVYDQKRVLATDVSLFRPRCDVPPPMSKRVDFALEIRRGDASLSTRGAASLRADKTSYVEQVDGAYALSAVEH